MSAKFQEDDLGLFETRILQDPVAYHHIAFVRRRFRRVLGSHIFGPPGDMLDTVQNWFLTKRGDVEGKRPVVVEKDVIRSLNVQCSSMFILYPKLVMRKSSFTNTWHLYLHRWRLAELSGNFQAKVLWTSLNMWMSLEYTNWIKYVSR